MDYSLLKKLYYKNRQQYEEEYLTRFNSVSAIRLSTSINENTAFIVITPEIVNLIYEIGEMNNKLDKLTIQLPPIALNQFIKKMLINEIILTNEIEGVISTRRDISEIIENVGKKEKHKRLKGLVNKYLKINSEEKLSIRTCQDIRNIYNDLVLEEISADDSRNLPDGVFFRKESVEFLSPFKKVIHEGVMPEEAINQKMVEALDILNDEKINVLLRIAIFHYLFGYIHPFYDGNGRVSRFISSYLLANSLNVLTGYCLAHGIKDNLSLYYNSFKMVNEAQNKGDLTPFVINFLEIIKNMILYVYESLSEKVELMNYYQELSYKMAEGKLKEADIIFILFQETLFGTDGISFKELVEASGNSDYKVRQIIDKLKKKELINEIKLGKKPLYSFDIEKVTSFNL